MRLTNIDISHVCDIEVNIDEVDFTPRDKNDSMSTDEISIDKMTASIWFAGHELKLNIWEATRYSVSLQDKIIDLVKERFHKESYEIMADENYPRPLVGARFRREV